jgi:hypothetical protein
MKLLSAGEGELPKHSSWRKRVGVEPKHSTPKSRRMMTLRLPPSSNWSQLESTHAGRARDLVAGLEQCGVILQARELEGKRHRESPLR